MQKWEYLQITNGASYPYLKSGKTSYYIDANGSTITKSDQKPDVYDYLNKLGSEGWELVSTDSWSSEFSSGTTYYFKRLLL